MKFSIEDIYAAVVKAPGYDQQKQAAIDNLKHKDGKNAGWKNNPESCVIEKVAVKNDSILKIKLAAGGVCHPFAENNKKIVFSLRFEIKKPDPALFFSD